MHPDPFLILAARADRIARESGAATSYVGWTRMQRLRRPPKAIFTTATSGPDGVTLTVRTASRVLAQIDHDAEIDVLRLRKSTEVTHA